MDLRDHFAGLAMQAMMDMYRKMYEDDIFHNWVEEAMPSLAERAYYMADYMMIARKKTNTYASKHGEKLIFGEGEE
jgi:hypothetical protein